MQFLSNRWLSKINYDGTPCILHSLIFYKNKRVPEQPFLIKQTTLTIPISTMLSSHSSITHMMYLTRRDTSDHTSMYLLALENDKYYRYTPRHQTAWPVTAYILCHEHSRTGYAPLLWTVPIPASFFSEAFRPMSAMERIRGKPFESWCFLSCWCLWRESTISWTCSRLSAGSCLLATMLSSTRSAQKKKQEDH